MYFEGNEATVNRYDAQASGASNWSGVWGVGLGGGGGGVDWGRVALLGEISLIFFGPMYSGFGGCVWVFLCPIVDIKLDRSS